MGAGEKRVAVPPKSTVQFHTPPLAMYECASSTQELHLWWWWCAVSWPCTLPPTCVHRSASEVKAAITKGGAKVAEPGSVAYNFTRAGQVGHAAGYLGACRGRGGL
jgi:hypothetical protein